MMQHQVEKNMEHKTETGAVQNNAPHAAAVFGGGEEGII